MDMTNKPFTASSLARAVDVHQTYIARLCRQGKIPAIMVGNSWIISYEDGMTWIKKREERLKQRSKT